MPKHTKKIFVIYAAIVLCCTYLWMLFASSEFSIGNIGYITEKLLQGDRQSILGFCISILPALVSFWPVWHKATISKKKAIAYACLLPIICSIIIVNLWSIIYGFGLVTFSGYDGAILYMVSVFVGVCTSVSLLMLIILKRKLYKKQLGTQDPASVVYPSVQSQKHTTMGIITSALLLIVVIGSLVYASNQKQQQRDTKQQVTKLMRENATLQQKLTAEQTQRKQEAKQRQQTTKPPAGSQDVDDMNAYVTGGLFKHEDLGVEFIIPDVWELEKAYKYEQDRVETIAEFASRDKDFVSTFTGEIFGDDERTIMRFHYRLLPEGRTLQEDIDLAVEHTIPGGKVSPINIDGQSGFRVVGIANEFGIQLDKVDIPYKDGIITFTLYSHEPTQTALFNTLLETVTLES